MAWSVVFASLVDSLDHGCGVVWRRRDPFGRHVCWSCTGRANAIVCIGFGCSFLTPFPWWSLLRSTAVRAALEPIGENVSRIRCREDVEPAECDPSSVVMQESPEEEPLEEDEEEEDEKGDGGEGSDGKGEEIVVSIPRDWRVVACGEDGWWWRHLSPSEEGRVVDTVHGRWSCRVEGAMAGEAASENRPASPAIAPSFPSSTKPFDDDDRERRASVGKAGRRGVCMTIPDGCGYKPANGDGEV